MSVLAPAISASAKCDRENLGRAGCLPGADRILVPVDQQVHHAWWGDSHATDLDGGQRRWVWRILLKGEVCQEADRLLTERETWYDPAG